MTYLGIIIHMSFHRDVSLSLNYMHAAMIVYEGRVSGEANVLPSLRLVLWTINRSWSKLNVRLDQVMSSLGTLRYFSISLNGASLVFASEAVRGCGLPSCLPLRSRRRLISDTVVLSWQPPHPRPAAAAAAAAAVATTGRSAPLGVI